MRDIKEIISEMERLSEDVAATINDEQSKVTSQEKELKALVKDAPATVDPVIGTYCCVVNVPNGFNIPVTSAEDPTVPAENQNLIFRTSELSCCVNPITVVCSAEDCPSGTFEVSAFEARLVGCIPFIANVFPITGVEEPNGNSTTCELTPSTTRICCSGNFCINRRIGVYATEAEARSICSDSGLITCSNITAELVATKLTFCEANGQGVQFSITFNSVSGNC
ncbi:hypothetical protein [Clostridium prolinivorans]|uniref:hypothetical protein n=1 Tax=Clostridium prolinivorans TaxID=2769420 RepID=UPI000FD75617|nr:hypothetical protein [Clostridium prolinivorans]